MTDTAPAIIQWISPEEGGRRTPAGPNYRCTVRFEADPTWLLGTWTFGLRNAQELDEPCLTFANVGFVADGAPIELLSEGAKFDLMEGPRVVASGMVVAPKYYTSVKSKSELLRHEVEQLRTL